VAMQGPSPISRGSTVIRVNRISLTPHREDRTGQQPETSTTLPSCSWSTGPPRMALSGRARPVSNRLDLPCVFIDPPRRNRGLDFRPAPILADSTRRKSLIRWQKRAAMWKHGFESRWGHHRQVSSDRVAADEPIDRQGAPELVASRTP
jgi:hypothetical protein